jgi:hypothetical protein
MVYLAFRLPNTWSPRRDLHVAGDVHSSRRESRIIRDTAAADKRHVAAWSTHCNRFRKPLIEMQEGRDAGVWARTRSRGAAAPL